MNIVAKFPVKLPLIFLIFTMDGSILFNRDFAYITTFECRRTTDETFAGDYFAGWQWHNNIHSSFIIINCIVISISLFSVNEDILVWKMMEEYFSYYQKCKKSRCYFFQFLYIPLNNFDDSDKCVLDDTNKRLYSLVAYFAKWWHF